MKLPYYGQEKMKIYSSFFKRSILIVLVLSLIFSNFVLISFESISEDNDSDYGTANSKPVIKNGDKSRTEDTIITWSGVKVIDSDFVVPSDYTLYVTPGTRVHFGANINLFIEGTLTADGTKGAIIFTALNKANKWQGIQFNSTANTLESEIRNCSITHGKSALVFKTGTANIVNCQFNDNDIGLDFYLSDGSISKSNFKSNNIAVRADTSNIIMSNSTISESITNNIQLRNNTSVKVINTTFSRNKIKIDDIYSEIEVKWYLKITVSDSFYPDFYGLKVYIVDFYGNTIHSIVLTDTFTTSWMSCTAFVIQLDPSELTNNKLRYYTSHLIHVDRFGLRQTDLVYLDYNKHVTVNWGDFSTNIGILSKYTDSTCGESFMHDFVNLGWKHTIRTEKVDAHNYLASRMRQFGFDVEFDNHTHLNNQIDNGTFVDIHVTNVVCTLSGESDDPDTYIAITAHYDTDHHKNVVGADDDGSGVTALLEIARLIGGLKFNTTIKFIFFDAEEEGYLGSFDYAKNANKSGHNIITDINLDMIGYNQNKSNPCIIRTNTNSLDIAQLFSDLESQIDFGLDVTIVNDASYRRSDYFRFWDFGYKAIDFVEAEVVEAWNPYYHSDEDTYDKINFTYLSKMTSLTLAGLVYLADPVDVPPEKPAQLNPKETHVNKPRITWQPSLDKNGDFLKYNLEVLIKKPSQNGNDQSILNLDISNNYYSFETNLTYGFVYEIKINGQDSTGLESDYLSSELRVYNTPPVLDFIPDQELVQDKSWEFQLKATDNDMPKDSLEFFTNSTLFEVNRKTGLINWTPSKYEIGNYLINFSVFDGIDGYDYQHVEIIIVNVNDPPEVLSAPSSVIFDEDTVIPNAINYNEIFSDVDGDSLEFGLKRNSSTIFEIKDNGSVDIRAEENWFGTEIIELTATDPFGLNNSVLVEIIVNPVNDAPVMKFLPDVVLNETEILILKPDGFDADGDQLSFNFTKPGTNGIWETDYFSAGTYTMNISVSDTSAADWQLINITVININRLPVSKKVLPEHLKIKKGEKLELEANFLDPDDDYNSNGILDGTEADNLTYIWEMGDGSQLSGKSVEHKYKKEGKFNIELTITDSENDSIYVNINLTVESQLDLFNSGKSAIIITSIITIVIILVILFILINKGTIKGALFLKRKEDLDKEKEEEVDDESSDIKPESKEKQ